jgi:hypothetical protein
VSKRKRMELSTHGNVVLMDLLLQLPLSSPLQHFSDQRDGCDCKLQSLIYLNRCLKSSMNASIQSVVNVVFVRYINQFY